MLFRIICTCAALLAFGWGEAGAEERIAASVYGQLPELADVAISPDGSKLALATNAPTLSSLVVVDTETLKALGGGKTREGQKLRGVDWIDDGMASFVVSEAFSAGRAAPDGWSFKGKQNRMLEYSRIGTLDVAKQRMALMMDKEAHAWADTGLTNLDAPIEGDEGFGRMVSSAGPGSDRLMVYRVDLKSGNGLSGPRLPENTSDWLFDTRGRLIAHAETDDRTNSWKVFADTGQSAIPLLEGQSLTGSAPPLLGSLPDGKLVIRRTVEGRDTSELQALDPASGATTTLLAPEGYDVGGVIQDPHTRQVVGGRYVDAFIPQQVFFDPELAEVYATLQASFPEGYASVVDWTKDRSTFVVFARNPTDAGAYYLYKAKERTLRRLGMIYPDLPENAIAPVYSITYKARDGVKVSGYITMPVGRDPKKLPLIALVHGGPHARDTLDFDYFAQFLASRGYLVLQPNFRGSTGFGLKWRDAGFGQWGGVMQTDVEDGVANLIRSGYADPQRVCIMGASYGGYAAFAGVTLTPDRYRCAISINGVSDLELMLLRTLQESSKQSGIYDWWTASMGDLKADKEKLRAVSPANHAAAVKSPVLVVYSKEDSVVPSEQPLRMIDQLRDAGKDVQVVQLKDDDHWHSTWEGRTELLEAIDRFLTEKMAPTG